MDRAAHAVNRRLVCQGDAETTHRLLARELWHQTAQTTEVRGRGVVRGLGYGRFAAWLESADLPRRDFPEREDIFGGIPFAIAPILSSGGTCSTFCLAGVLTGSDKADHFLDTGYLTWRKARQRGLKGVRWGTWTENTFLGWLTSSAFSYADLYANWLGSRFYDTLLDDPRGVFELQDGCVIRVRDFDWASWVDWRWDEVLDPSVYRPKVQAWLDARLDDDATTYCEGWERWGPQVQAQVQHALEEEAIWAGDHARPRTDPFRLAERCAR